MRCSGRDRDSQGRIDTASIEHCQKQHAKIIYICERRSERFRARRCTQTVEQINGGYRSCSTTERQLGCNVTGIFWSTLFIVLYYSIFMQYVHVLAHARPHNALHSPSCRHNLIQFEHRFLPAGARAVRERLVLRLLFVFRVCLFVCL